MLCKYQYALFFQLEQYRQGSQKLMNRGALHKPFFISKAQENKNTVTQYYITITVCQDWSYMQSLFLLSIDSLFILINNCFYDIMSCP